MYQKNLIENWSKLWKKGRTAKLVFVDLLLQNFWSKNYKMKQNKIPSWIEELEKIKQEATKINNSKNWDEGKK